MKKTPALTKQSRAALVKREREIAADVAMVSRLNRRERQITQLSQQLTRSVRKADTDRIIAARALVEGSEYVVTSLAFMEELERGANRARESATLLTAQLDTAVRKLDELERRVLDVREENIEVRSFAGPASE